MQDNKQILCNALAKVMKKLRGSKSLSLFASEYDISTSIICNAERGLKDPQLTTLYKLSEAYNIQFDKFIKLIMEELPEGFTLIDK